MQTFELCNDAGLRLTVLDFGATLVALAIPVNGEPRNVLLGCDVSDYPVQTSYLGAIAGPFANRIGGALLTRNGQHWPLDANQHGNCLHGGFQALHNQTWQLVEQTRERIVLTCQLADGVAGFPGNRQFWVEYRLDGLALAIALRAQTDAATPINLTSHAYFNLDGAHSGQDVREQTIRIAADHYLPTDPVSIPLGIAPVEGVFDLRQTRRIGEQWFSHPQQEKDQGFDHCFVLQGDINQAAVTLTSADQRLSMQMFSDQPGVQLYTGNFLEGCHAPHGETWHPYQGVCLEAQNLPDCPNRPELGDPWLLPGQVYRQQTCYRFLPN
ncbi:aldose epimerase family protein [Aeromonas enteropelogenes]|uniref:aldose epimerase family protein n=1 Tax=Aeromonas enteropelogenes TaxID=29489 RepID=UPI0039899383